MALLICCTAYQFTARAQSGSNSLSHLTIYNAGIGEVLEERTIELQQGLNTIEWRSLMPKAYIRTVRVLAEDAEVLRQDVTYDGAQVNNEKSPVLHLLIQNRGATARKRVQVDYLAPGISWQADYALVLEPTANGEAPAAAALDSWVSLHNDTGVDLLIGTVDLVAGEIALLLNNGGGDYRAGYAAQINVSNTVAVTDSSMDESNGESYAEVSSLSAFNRLTLGNNISLNANGSLNGQGTQRALMVQDISGRYAGIAKTQSHGELPVSAEIRQDKGTITGSMNTPLGDLSIPGGSYTQGILTLKVESYDDEGTITASVKDGKLVGDFEGFGEKARLELTRTGPPAPLVDTRPIASLSTEKWLEDLHYLATELPRHHKNAFHTITKEQFERAVAELQSKIPSMQDSDRVFGLSRIVAMIGDGHTHLQWGQLYPNVPLRMYWFGHELRVTETITAYRRALGARVVRIGNVDTAEAYRRDQPFISQGESPGFVLSTNADLMANPAHLHALGLAPDTTHALYTFEDDKGKRFALTLRTLGPGEQVSWIDAASTRPLYRQRQDEPLWYKYLPETQTLYVNFKGYPRRKLFSKFSQELFDFIDHHTVQRVIVDMRENGGGDFSRGREFIISQFKQRPALTQRGRLFVVIGRWTYSAGMANAADFRNDLNAILVGEPTGARPNGYQENRQFSLPNSHLVVSYSTQLYKFQDQDTQGILPDKRIDPDWTYYKTGRDPVLEWILASQSNQ
jgi:hypothetical protein